MDAGTEIRIKGLNEFRSALRKIDSELPKELNRGFQKIAERIASATSLKVKHLTGRAASSLTARSGGKVAAGGSKAPHYPWLDFGGGVGKGKRIKRTFIRKGRYLYPTIAERGPEIKRETDEVLARLARNAGFDTTGGL